MRSDRALDTNAADLPRQWDSYEGTTRVQRAQAFEDAMQQLGASSVLRVFGDAKHEVISEMRLAACKFLGGAMLPREPFGSPLAEAPVPMIAKVTTTRFRPRLWAPRSKPLRSKRRPATAP